MEMADLVDAVASKGVLRLWQCPECRYVAIDVLDVREKRCPSCFKDERRVELKNIAYVVEREYLVRLTLKAEKVVRG